MQLELKTNRLLLRNMTLEDYDNLYEIRFHKEVLKFIKRDIVEDKLEMKTFISERLVAIKNYNLCFWGISKISNPKLIGTICLWNFNKTKTSAEVGYELHPDYHGQGLMSEALKSVINFGFNELNLISIEAFTSTYNKPSKMLLEKFNFILDSQRRDQGFPDNIIYTKQNA